MCTGSSRSISVPDRTFSYHVMKIGCLLQCLFLFMLSLAKPNGYYQVDLVLSLHIPIDNNIRSSFLKVLVPGLQ
jgi:hypothetical protein